MKNLLLCVRQDFEGHSIHSTSSAMNEYLVWGNIIRRRVDVGSGSNFDISSGRACSKVILSYPDTTAVSRRGIKYWVGLFPRS